MLKFIENTPFTNDQIGWKALSNSANNGGFNLDRLRGILRWNDPNNDYIDISYKQALIEIGAKNANIASPGQQNSVFSIDQNRLSIEYSNNLANELNPIDFAVNQFSEDELITDMLDKHQAQTSENDCMMNALNTLHGDEFDVERDADQIENAKNIARSNNYGQGKYPSFLMDVSFSNLLELKEWLSEQSFEALSAVDCSNINFQVYVDDKQCELFAGNDNA